MPLLNLTPDNTIRNVIRDFKHETGLKLVVLDGKTPAKGSMTIYELLRKKYKPRHSRYISHDILRIYPECMVTFDYRCSIDDIRIIFKQKSKLDISIHDANGRKIDNRKKLEDVLPRLFKKLEIDWEKIKRLNRRVERIGKDIERQCMALAPSLRNRVRKKSDWLDDFEFEVIISYILDRNDPLYYEDFDNIIIEQKVGIDKENGGMDNEGIDYNDWEPRDKKVRQRHGYLFHDIYDHLGLTRVDVQRIGDIYVDMQVWFQHFYRVKKNRNNKKGKIN